MLRIVIGFIIIIAYKTLSNFISLFQIQKYEKEFIKYLSGEPSKIEEYKLLCIALFKKAGIKDTETPITQPTGYGRIASFNASVFQNFPSNIAIIANPALNMFKNASGIYKSRIYEGFNPIYWVDLIIFLPKNLLSYIGLDSEKAAFKIWNVFLTFIWWVFCTLVTFFQPEIKAFFTDMLT